MPEGLFFQNLCLMVSFSIHVPGCDISWSLLHAVHDNDEKLNANLQKAPKSTPVPYTQETKNVQLVYHFSV